ncbi:MAG: hypothetical protein ABW321_03145, partial [Polyangiales bacterium]
LEGRSLTRMATGDGPVDCLFIDEHTIAVSHRFENHVWLLDRSGSAAPRQLALGAPLGRLARSPAGELLAVSVHGREPHVALLTLPTLSVQTRLPLTEAADQLTFGTTAGELIVATRGDATVRAYTSQGGSTYRETAVHRLGRPAVFMTRGRGGQALIVATTDYRPDRRPQLGNHFVQDQLLTLDSQTLALRDRSFTARRSERQSKPGDVDQGGSPMAACQLPSGELAITFAGTDELWQVPDLAHDHAGVQRDLRHWELLTPHGVACLADGRVLVSSPVAGRVGVFRPGAREPEVFQLAPDDAQLPAAALLRREGERGFFESTRAGIACQSCHLHAESDASAYNLGDHRLVPTLSVEGLLGTAPYLRDGSYARIEDLDDVAQTLYRGYLRPQVGRRPRLQAYIDGLARPQPWPSVDRNAERRGYAVFQQAGCDRCHTPPAFTNLAQIPLAALFPQLAARFPERERIDVPSLLSVAGTAPYLNDGRASSLRAVIDDENPGDLHGSTRSLTEDQRRDLVAFLESL